MVNFQILQDRSGDLYLHVNATETTTIVSVNQAEIVQLEDVLQRPPAQFSSSPNSADDHKTDADSQNSGDTTDE